MDISKNVLNKIREAKEENLKELHLSFSSLSFIPDEVFDLEQIEILNLSRNRINTISQDIIRLTNLKFLDLSGNQLKAVPDSITNLINLTHISLANNQLTTLPDSITNLENLTQINLNENKFEKLPQSIERLSKLTQLFLSHNRLRTIPAFITNLTELTQLNLERNYLNNFPKPLKHLRNLAHLSLANNEIKEIPEFIINLDKLIYLNLDGNKLNAIPDIFANLTKLLELSLFDNYLITIPESIINLYNLKYLNLANNKLKEVTESIVDLRKLERLDLRSNPLEKPPVEIANQGIKAIRDYFRQLNEEGKDYIYEAKLLIIGEPGAGKTTLANKINDIAYELQDEISTKGIDVIQWKFPLENGKEFTVNIWDFGGQEIYHATHQFFLTKRSLYTLVADTRKEDTDFYYWLKVVELLSDNSPLLIIKNEKQDRRRDINDRALRGEFENLKETLATNLSNNRGLAEILTQIKHHICSLPHIGAALPKTWKKVREALEQDPRNYITLDEYLQICENNGFNLRKDKLQLSGYLNDLGVCLHFQDDKASVLYKTVILKPEWGTDAVYKVLDNPQVIENRGRFNSDDLEEIWHEEKYTLMQVELLELMKKFQLCYEIPEQKNHFIAPQLLTENQPEYNWDESNNLILRYTYEFMPKGIITRFIVIMHRWIEQQQYVWKSGVILAKEDTRAEIIEYYGKREIKIRVAGKHKRDLLNNVTYELDKIHESYNRLKYSKLIPCNCSICKDSQSPHFYSFSTLRKFISDRQDEIQCQLSYQMVNVFGLIDDFMSRKQFIEDQRKGNLDSGKNIEAIESSESDSINQQEDKTESNDRTINIYGDIYNSGAGAFSLGDISGTVANTINQLSNSDSSNPGIKELLEKLFEAIKTETTLDDLDKEDALEEVQNIAEASLNTDSHAKTTIITKSVRRLGRIVNELPVDSRLGDVSKEVLPAIAQIFNS